MSDIFTYEDKGFVGTHNAYKFTYQAYIQWDKPRNFVAVDLRLFRDSACIDTNKSFVFYTIHDDRVSALRQILSKIDTQIKKFELSSY